MIQAEFVKLCYREFDRLKSLSPIDTGNLRYNAIRIEFPNENECNIYVDEDIAPYMPYTNEPWISPRWNGKKNPNEKWFDNAVKVIANDVALATQGELQ